MARKKPNQKAGSGEYLYRIVMAILSLCVPVAAFFCDYIYLVLESDVFRILAQLTGDTADTGATSSVWSLRRAVEDLLPLISENESGTAVVLSALDPLKPAMISFAIFFVLAVVLAIVVFFFSCFSRKKTVPMCIAGGGILSMIAMYISFRNIATPLMDGSISLSSFFSSSLLTSIVAGMSSFSTIRVTTGFFVMLFLFIGMTLWAGANKLIDLGDKPAKDNKKK